MIKEGVDDYNRYKQDKEANSQIYKYPMIKIEWKLIMIIRVFASTSVKVDQPSSNLKVGDIIEVNANQRIPADLLLLYTS